MRITGDKGDATTTRRAAGGDIGMLVALNPVQIQIWGKDLHMIGNSGN
jgi:hypothetical protein